MATKIGLALGGGGARGLCHIEFCKALDEMGLKPSIISGTSIGSIVGGFYAAGMSGDEMKALIEQIGLIEYTRLLDFSILSPAGLVKGNAVMEFLDEHLPVKTFEELEIPLKVVATDFWNRKEIVFESGPLIPAIRASISIPVVFKPVKVGDLVLTDGGTVNPVPYDIIRNACDILIAIDVSGTIVPEKARPVPSMFEAIMNAFLTMETALLRHKMKYIQPDIYVKPVLENIQVLDFHRHDEIMESVEMDVVRFKRELESKMKRVESGEKRSKKKWLRVFKRGMRPSLYDEEVP